MEKLLLILFVVCFTSLLTVEPNPTQNETTTIDRLPDNYPQQYKVAVGDSTKLTCAIENYDKLTSWRRQDGQPLPSSAHLSNGDFMIDYTQRDAAGLYECIVHESHGEYPIVAVELVVVELPKVVFYPKKSLTVQIGERVNIRCDATGDDPIHIEWHNEDHRPFPPNVRATGNNLEFLRITPNNSGRYYCSASNPNGVVTRTADVIVQHSEIPDLSSEQTENGN
ncbi:protein sax-3-like isoform X2 [Sitodiplosis mosellana]|uniref:protein sax-3-like isoform X2 n=1 Tax=Sitodiplosis mosellana TaxID=263140 RepID=UPI002444E98D|nr:protein sax-3-like isoform X2 [Sitodiplosis mosellana]